MTAQVQPNTTNNKLPLLLQLKYQLIDNITQQLDEKTTQPEARVQLVEQYLRDALNHHKLNIPDNQKRTLYAEVRDEILGYGPIQRYLDDPEVSEVMVNRADRVYIEKNGKLIRTPAMFENDEHVLRIINRIVLPLGRSVDRDSPTVDARLPDGSRVNAAIPPVAIDGPSITIRKFTKNKLSVQELIEFGSITESMAEFIKACVLARLNIVVAGGTGSGKTTLLNILSGFIPEDERIITIEDAAELVLRQDHVLRMETKPKNADGMGMVTVRDLVRNSLRMRPDRIIVGEVRGGEALDMLQAMNTGHDGSLTTVHANSPRDAISRLETLSLMAGLDLPLRVIREQIASAVDVVIQQTRLRDGTRKVVSITEVAGMEGDVIVMTEIFRFNQTGVDPEGHVQGEMVATGLRPLFGPKLEEAGLKLGAQLFQSNILEVREERRRMRR